MSLGKGKVEGGLGGKRGHSNMTHWTFTEEIKKRSRKKRRLESKRFSQSVQNQYSYEEDP